MHALVAVPVVALLGQLFGGPSRLVITSPDGGTPSIIVEGQAQVTCDFADGGRCLFDVQGRNGGPLLVEQQAVMQVYGVGGTRVGVEGPVIATIDGVPTFSLSAATLAALAAPTCICALPQVVTITPTPVQLPLDGGHADPTTQWHLTNLAVSRNACCLPSFDGGSGGLDCNSAAYIGLANGGTIDIEGLQQTHTVFCKADGTLPAHVAKVNVWECSCQQ